MRAVEVVLQEMTASFDGIDPLKPAHPKLLTAMRENLGELAECEPDAEMLALVRSTVPAMRT